MDLNDALRVVSGEAENELARAKLAIAAESDARAQQRRDKRRALVTMAPRIPGILPTVSALSEHERRNFSVARLLQNLVQNQGRRTGLEQSLETEVSQGISADLGNTPPPHGGAWLPLRLAGGLDSKSAASGGFVTATRVGDILDALRAQTKVLQLGAQLLTGLKFSPQFPVEITPMSAVWISENGGTDVSASDPVFGQKSMTMKMLAATTSFSRQLLADSSANPSIEAWIRSRIALAHGQALDLASIHGLGSSNQPLGLLNTTGITVIAIGASGGSPTADFVIALENAVGAANADNATCAFLTNSVTRSRLRKNPEITGGSTPLWRDSTMLGHRAEVSNQIRGDLTKGANSDCSAIVYCDFSKLLIGEFQGAIEVVSDPYALKKRGMVEISSFAGYDILMSQPGAAAAIVDARNV